MTKRTRVFLLIAAGVLVLGVGAGLVAYYTGFTGLSVGSANEPDELSYLPQDSSLVAFANVRDVMASDLHRRLQEMRSADAASGPNDFEARTGIDIETDVDVVVASLAGGGDNERPLVVARGRFDEARIEALIREQGGQVEEYRNERLFIVSAGDEPFGVSFVESGVVAIGTVAAVRRAIDTKATRGASVTGNEELMAQVRGMDQGNAWAVGRFDTLAGNRLPEAVASQLPPISWFAATGRVNGGVEGLVRVEAGTEQGAQDLRQVVQGFMALARLQTRDNTEFATLLNSLQLGGEGRTVSLSFSVPLELMDALGALQQRREPPPQPPLPPAPPAGPRPPAS